MPRDLPVKKFLKSVKNWHNYGHESVAPFFWPTLYVGHDHSWPVTKLRVSLGKVKFKLRVSKVANGLVLFFT